MIFFIKKLDIGAISPLLLKKHTLILNDGINKPLKGSKQPLQITNKGEEKEKKKAS